MQYCREGAMPGPLSEDPRVRQVEAVEAGGTIRAVGERLGGGAPSPVSKIHQRRPQTGSVTAVPIGGDRRSGATEAYEPRILALRAAQPDLTQDEICAAPGRGSIGRFFRRHGISVNKRRTRPNRRVRTWRRTGACLYTGARARH